MSLTKLFSLVLVVSLSLCVFGCGIFENEKPKPKPEPEPIAPESQLVFNLSGSVVDETGNPVSDVKIAMKNTSNATFSNVNGEFTFNDVSIGTYTLTAQKTGYSYIETKCEVTQDGASVPDVTLKNLREITNKKEAETTTDNIKTNGIEIVSEFNREVSTGGTNIKTEQKSVQASVPKDTEITIDNVKVSGSVTLAAAPLEVNDTPPANKDELSFGAAIFEPENAKFSQPVEVKVPLEIQLPAGLEIPLKKYENGQWKTVGTAKIDESGLGADAGVTEFGQFSIQPKVTFDLVQDTQPDTKESAPIPVSAGQTKYVAQAKDTVDFPSGLPEGVSVKYAKSLIEKTKGITIGAYKNVVINSPLVQTKTTAKVAKIAAVEELWETKWTVVKKTITHEETITITIDFDKLSKPAAPVEFKINYLYKEEKFEPKIESQTVKWFIDVTVNGVGGVTIDVSGGFSASATLQDGESHRFLGETGKNYTLTPSKPGWTFTPSSVSITKLGEDVSYTFTAKKIATKITISGTVTGADEVTVTLGGATSDAAIVSESGGKYTFAVDANKNYTVTPSKAGYSFDTPSASFTNISSNATQDFVAKMTKVTISGTVNGANGVKVTVSGDVSDSKDLINAGDSYSFTVNVGGNYTVSATKGDFIVTPESQSFTNLTSDTTVDFVAQKKQKRVYIAGSVVGANNVTVTLSGDASKSATLSDGGSYSWEVKAGGNYTISASASGVQFEQSSASYTNLEVDAGLIFKAIQYVTISGSLTHAADGSTIPDVTVSLSGAASESKTVSGSYSFTVKAGGTYSVTPSKANYTFLPSSSDNANVTQNTTQNFDGTRWFTISGTVSGPDGVFVTLNGTLAGSQTVDNGGSYSFTVKAGGTYQVSVSKTGYTFDTPSSTFSNLNADATQNFKVIKHSQGTVQ